jgi:hypothetical protein
MWLLVLLVPHRFGRIIFAALDLGYQACLANAK